MTSKYKQELDQYIVGTLKSLLRKSNNGVLSRPHLTQIFQEHNIKLDFKRLVKKGVLMDFGHAINQQNGSIITIYTDKDNLDRANEWKFGSIEKQEESQRAQQKKAELLSQGVQVVDSQQSDAVITSEQTLPNVSKH